MPSNSALGKLRAGLYPDPQFIYPANDVCGIRVHIWIKEYGKHGVQQFKWRYRRYLGTINRRGGSPTSA